MKPIKTITEALFWKFVGEFNWPKNFNDYDKIKYKFLTDYPEFAEAFRNMCVSKVSDLYDAVKKWEDDGVNNVDVSDDGLSDLLWHIVGMGKTQFEKHLKTPALIAKRATNSGYKESFCYAVPGLLDLDDLKPQKYIDWAVKAFKEFSAERTQRVWIDEDEKNGMNDLAYNKAICIRIAQGDFKVTQAERDKTKKHANKYGSWYVSNLVSDLLNVGEFLSDEPFKAVVLEDTTFDRMHAIKTLEAYWLNNLPSGAQWRYILKNGFVTFHNRDNKDLQKSLKKLVAKA